MSPKALEGARKALAHQEQQRQRESSTEEEHHWALIAHFFGRVFLFFHEAVPIPV